jgi:glucose-6-phosphate isomerase
VHSVINADPAARMVFGAWCDRQYGFVYDAIRAHHGPAWFPVLNRDRNLTWEPNPSYGSSELLIRGARNYPELRLDPGTPIYEQFANHPDSIQWVSEPARVASLWTAFEM